MRGNKKYSILADHLGTPIEAYADDGNLIWERSLNANGKVLKETGIQNFCPFLYQGQSFDNEIELAYNRFRYYDVEDGRYISQDPIGLLSGEFGFYNYVPDTNIWTDEFGLAYDKHKKNGQFAKKPGRKSKKQRKNRKNQYPSGYRAGIVDSVVKKNTVNGVIYDKFGDPIARKDVTIEHNKPVVQHWNEGGNNMSRAERADFYNDTSNMSILSKADNSSRGGLMNDVYTQTTGPNYSN